MKSLKDYIAECGAAATPANTVGAGNPMPPGGPTGQDPTVPGSGDTFTAKAKKEKKKLKESILDTDLDISDDQVLRGNMIDWCKKLREAHDKKDLALYNSTRQEMMYALENMAEEWDGDMKIWKDKTKTIVTFKDKSYGVRGAVALKDTIEVRRFVKNPLPYSIQFAVNNETGKITDRYKSKTNHPTKVDLNNSAIYILPGDCWDAFEKEYSDNL